MHGETAHARAKRASAHTAIEAASFGREGGGIERLLKVAREHEPRAAEPAAVDVETQPLHHERRIVGVEPVPLALTRHEPASVVLAAQGLWSVRRPRKS